jgi:hypothetical protein
VPVPPRKMQKNRRGRSLRHRHAGTRRHQGRPPFYPFLSLINARAAACADTAGGVRQAKGGNNLLQPLNSSRNSNRKFRASYTIACGTLESIASRAAFQPIHLNHTDRCVLDVPLERSGSGPICRSSQAGEYMFEPSSGNRADNSATFQLGRWRQPSGRSAEDVSPPANGRRRPSHAIVRGVDQANRTARRAGGWNEQVLATRPTSSSRRGGDKSSES